MPMAARITVDGPITNGPQLGPARRGPLVHTIMRSELWVRGEEGFVNFVRLLCPHVTTLVSLTRSKQSLQAGRVCVHSESGTKRF